MASVTEKWSNMMKIPLFVNEQLAVDLRVPGSFVYAAFCRRSWVVWVPWA